MERDSIKAVYESITPTIVDPRSPITVLGHRMFVGSKDTLRLSAKGIHEPPTTALVAQEIAEGDVVLDIGAHIGYYSLIFARLVGVRGKVFSFEPDPSNFAILKRNAQLNGYSNIELVEMAVANRTGSALLYLSRQNLGDHRIYDPGGEREAMAVEVTRLDEFLGEFNQRIDFMKLDIQGAEADALLGAGDLLDRNKTLRIVTEFWPLGLELAGTDPIDYLELLSSHGFTLFEIRERRSRSPVRTEADKLLNKYTAENGTYTNLFCKRLNQA